jgi:hypothetical protein
MSNFVVSLRIKLIYIYEVKLSRKLSSLLSVKRLWFRILMHIFYSVVWKKTLSGSYFNRFIISYFKKAMNLFSVRSASKCTFILRSTYEMVFGQYVLINIFNETSRMKFKL